MIVIPVNERHTLRRLHRTGKVRIQRNIIIFVMLRNPPEIHIAPYHRLKTELFAYLIHALQMRRHDFGFVMISVFVQILSKSQRPRFIHSQMHPLRMERLCRIFNARFYKIINLLISRHQDVIRILHPCHRRPAQSIFQMGERLDTRNHLTAEQLRIIRHLTQLFLRIASAHIAKIRIFRHFISILRIKHQRIHADRRLHTDILLNRFHGQDAVSGAVQHRSVPVQKNRLFPGKILRSPPIFKLAYKTHQRTEEKCFMPGCQDSFSTVSILSNCIDATDTVTLHSPERQRNTSCRTSLSADFVSPRSQQLADACFIPFGYAFTCKNHFENPLFCWLNFDMTIILYRSWKLNAKYCFKKDIYSPSRTIIRVYPSRFFPLHLLISNLSGSFIDRPIPQILSLTAHSAKIEF